MMIKMRNKEERGLPFMTTTLEGEGGHGEAGKCTDRLHEWDSDKVGRGSKDPKILLAS